MLQEARGDPFLLVFHQSLLPRDSMGTILEVNHLALGINNQ